MIRRRIAKPPPNYLAQHTIILSALSGKVSFNLDKFKEDLEEIKKRKIFGAF